MGVCKEKCYSNKEKNKDLLIRIEELREELHNIVSKTEGSNSRVISKSEELDRILNEYYKETRNK